MNLRTLSVVVLLFIATPCSGAISPYESVKSATDDLLAKLNELRPAYDTDQGHFFSEIDKALAPFVDFEGFSRGVMAKFYRRATPDQRTAFAERFRELLIQTYAKALVEFDNQKVVVREDVKTGRDASRAAVTLDIHGKNGAIYPVEYSLVLKDDVWKLRNVVINGINIGLQFKSQFGFYMQKHRNDIDSVIEAWRVDG